MILNNNIITPIDFKKKYKSGHLLLIIKNLIIFFCFMFVNFFIYTSIIPLDDYQLKKLLIDKENVENIKYNELNEYVLLKLKKFNSRLNQKNFIACCYSYIFDPIKICK